MKIMKSNISLYNNNNNAIQLKAKELASAGDQEKSKKRCANCFYSNLIQIMNYLFY